MGDGTIIESLAVWKGKMQLGEVIVEGEFEVFNSGGSWAFLLGKPTLQIQSEAGIRTRHRQHPGNGQQKNNIMERH